MCTTTGALGGIARPKLTRYLDSLVWYVTTVLMRCFGMNTTRVLELARSQNKATNNRKDRAFCEQF
jgi:hypothetical protein